MFSRILCYSQENVELFHIPSVFNFDGSPKCNCFRKVPFHTSTGVLLNFFTGMPVRKNTPWKDHLEKVDCYFHTFITFCFIKDHLERVDFYFHNRIHQYNHQQRNTIHRAIQKGCITVKCLHYNTIHQYNHHQVILQLHEGGLINKWFKDEFKPAIFMNNPDPVQVLTIILVILNEEITGC